MTEVNPMQQKFEQIRNEMTQEFVERDEEITGTLVSILSKQHMLLIGVPGTAKSMLADTVCNRISGAEYFQWLLTKFSTPEELFGPVSLSALENDKYTRITTNKLPECHIAFLDEIFKANSAILNALLTAVNERKFHNNGHPVDIPLQSIFGASNELPESEELGALYDRFLLRYEVNYIGDDSDFAQMLKGTGNQNPTKLTLAELEAAQQEVEQVDIPDAVLELVIEIRNQLRNEGVVPSDRRYKQALKVIKAHAYLEGRMQATEEDVAILRHVLWDQPTEIKTVEKTILGVSNPTLNKITELLDQADEVYDNIQKIANDPDNEGNVSGEAVEANAKLKKVGEQLADLRKDLEKQDRDTSRVTDAEKKVQDMNKNILKECLGLDF